MRFYMPGLHRHFLNYVESNISVRRVIAEHCYGPDHMPSSAASSTARPSATMNGHAHLNGHHTAAAPSSTDSSLRLSSCQPVLRDPELIAAFNACVDELVVLRTKHIGLVTTYILTQAHNLKNKIAPRPVSLPTSSSSPSLSASHSANNLLGVTQGSLGSSPVTPRSPVSEASDNGTSTAALSPHTDADGEHEATARSTGERGTGGTSIMPYLKTSRDETRSVRL